MRNKSKLIFKLRKFIEVIQCLMSSFLIKKVFGVHTDYVHGVSSPAPEWPRKSNDLKFFSTHQSHNVKSLNSLDIDRILSGQLGC